VMKKRNQKKSTACGSLNEDFRFIKGLLQFVLLISSTFLLMAFLIHRLLLFCP